MNDILLAVRPTAGQALRDPAVVLHLAQLFDLGIGQWVRFGQLTECGSVGEADALELSLEVHHLLAIRLPKVLGK